MMEWNEIMRRGGFSRRDACFYYVNFFHACTARIFIAVHVYFSVEKYGFCGEYFSKITKRIKAVCAFDGSKKRIELFLTRRMIKATLCYMFRGLSMEIYIIIR